MAKLLLVFSDGIYTDLADRPGRSKLEKESSAVPRKALLKTLERLSRDMIDGYGSPHLRADIFDDPFNILKHYKPDSFSTLLSNFWKLRAIPNTSAFAAEHPDGYVIAFRFPRIGWMALAVYLEVQGQPTLVFVKAGSDTMVKLWFKDLKADPLEFDKHFKAALKAVEHLDKSRSPT